MDNLTKKEQKGFNQFFERSMGERKLPFINSFDMNSFLEEMSASKLSGGIIKSKDGRLEVNLDEGRITYDGDDII